MTLAVIMGAAAVIMGAAAVIMGAAAVIMGAAAIKGGAAIIPGKHKGAALSYKKYDSDRSTRYTRKSLRLPTHNYGWTGNYFVTMCAKEPGTLFETPELHTILIETWHDLPNRFPGLRLDEFVVMPDHVHFIIHLEGNVDKPATLGQVVGAYKSITTVAWLRHIEATGMNCSGLFWQGNYYERVLRDKQELEEKREYTRNNPLKLKKAPKPDES